MNLARELEKRIETCPKRVIVIGDAMTDVWIHGRLEGCQDYCSKLMEESRVTVPGGASNARRSLQGWTKNIDLYARATNDRPLKIRFVDTDGSIAFRHDDETVFRKVDDYNWLREEALEAAKWCGGVLLSDYDKGFLTPSIISRIVEVCDKRNIPCVVDAKRHPDIYEGCLIKSNWDWARSWKHCNKGVVTRGELCPLVNSKNVYPHTPNLPPVNCINHVGAGDCFAAHLILALTYGFTLLEAATLAHSAGRVYVQHPHNAPPDPEAIAADLELVAP